MPSNRKETRGETGMYVKGGEKMPRGGCRKLDGGEDSHSHRPLSGKIDRVNTRKERWQEGANELRRRRTCGTGQELAEKHAADDE